ncbi:MAG: winged helix-turn-helix domain-containing protein [Devosia sp.]
MVQSGFGFGAFHFDPRQKLLFRGSEIMPLGRRGATILEILLTERGTVLRKEQLIEAAWPDEAIEESNLSVQIAKLRRTIGAEWIRTVERVGYQFVGTSPNTVIAGGRRELGDAFPVLALLALEQSDDAALDYTARALRAEFIVALTRYRSLHLTTPETGDRVADYHLALSLHARDDRPGRAMLKLSEAMSGRIVWAQSFDAGRSAIVESMVAGVESAVQSAEYRDGPRGNAPGAEAYGHYLTGRRLLNSSLARDNGFAFARFMAAVTLEPENATYLAAASEAMHHRLSVGWEWLKPDDKQIARDLAYRTLALSSDDAVSLALVGNTMFTVDEEDLGLTLSRRAVAMNPHSQLTLACGLHAELWGGSLTMHERLSRRAAALAPNDPGQRFALNGRATAARLRGDDEAALNWARRALAVGRGYSSAHWNTIAALVALGRQDEAERHLRRYLIIAPGVTQHSIERGQHVADRSRLKPLFSRLRQAGLPAR